MTKIASKNMHTKNAYLYKKTFKMYNKIYKYRKNIFCKAVFV